MLDFQPDRSSEGVNRPIRRLSGKSYLVHFGEWTGGQTFKPFWDWVVRDDGYAEVKCPCGDLCEGVVDELTSCSCGWFYLFDGARLWVVECPRNSNPSA
jgi:hypothetical protein